MKNTIWSLNSGFIILPTRSFQTGTEEEATISKIQLPLLASFIQFLQVNGWSVSNQLVSALASLDYQDFRFLCKDIFNVANAYYEKWYNTSTLCMYAGFPAEVESMSEAEMYFSQIIHYLSNGEIVFRFVDPEKDIFVRSKSSPVVLKTLHAVSEKEMLSFLGGMLSGQKLFTPDEIAYLQEYPEFVHYLVQNYSISNRANVAIVANIIYDISETDALNLMKTRTDMLRFAAYRYLNDAMLEHPASFSVKSIPRSVRRHWMKRMDEIAKSGNNSEMRLHESYWKKWSMVVHPGEYKQYANAFRDFEALWNNRLDKTVYGQIEDCMKNYDVEGLMRVSTNVPGVFARNVIQYLVKFPEKSHLILRYFENLAVQGEFEPNVLISIIEAIRNRSEPQRVFIPKGKSPYVVSEKAPLPQDNVTITLLGLCINTFLNHLKIVAGNQFGEALPIKVYVDPICKKLRLPNGQTDTSSIRYLTKGSALPIDNGKIVRAFLFWKNQNEDTIDIEQRVDLDLSAVLLDENLCQVKTIAYHSLHRTPYATFSGDIVNGHGGAAEYIDIDIDALRNAEQDVRYVCFTANSFTKQPFSSLEKSSAGWMTFRSKDDSRNGLLWDPAMVQMQFDLNSKTTQSTMFLMDVIERDVIWLDQPGTGAIGYHSLENTISRNAAQHAAMSMVVKSYHFSVYDLMSLFAVAAGKQVDTIEEADLIVAPHGAWDPFIPQTWAFLLKKPGSSPVVVTERKVKTIPPVPQK